MWRSKRCEDKRPVRWRAASSAVMHVVLEVFVTRPAQSFRVEDVSCLMQHKLWPEKKVVVYIISVYFFFFSLSLHFWGHSELNARKIHLCQFLTSQWVTVNIFVRGRCKVIASHRSSTALWFTWSFCMHCSIRTSWMSQDIWSGLFLFYNTLKDTCQWHHQGIQT